METTNKKSRGLYWLLFFASVAAFFMIYTLTSGNMLTVTLPFIVYFFAKAMDII
jgi:hypothetical protein